MDIRKQVGGNLRLLRKRKRLTQEKLGFAADMHRTYISGIERGLKNPTIDSLDKLAKALEVPPALLLAE